MNLVAVNTVGSNGITAFRTTGDNGIGFQIPSGTNREIVMVSDSGSEIARFDNNKITTLFGKLITPSASLTATTFANAVVNPTEGTLQAFTDSTSITWGGVITGGGANHVVGWWNGTAWKVMAG